MPTKCWKNTSKSCILMAVGTFFLSEALTAQNSPELHFCFIYSLIQSSLLRSLFDIRTKKQNQLSINPISLGDLSKASWVLTKVIYPKYYKNSDECCTFFYWAFFYHIFMCKTSMKLEILYIVGSPVKTWFNLKVRKLSILEWSVLFGVKID